MIRQDAGQKSGLITIDPFAKVRDVTAFIDKIGQDIAKSGIWKCDYEATGRVLALEVFASRTPPLSLARRFEFIAGRLSMKADAMLADLDAIGGDYEVHEYSPDKCDITFSNRTGKRRLRLAITWEEAQRERWPWVRDKQTGKDKLKDTWATPIGRQDMLWARVVSRGVRRVEPQVVAGKYTPEELREVLGEQAEYVEYEIHEDAAGSPTISVGSCDTIPEAVATSLEEQITKDEPEDGDSTSTQTERIRELCELLSIPLYKQQDMQAKRGVSAWRSLSAEQAAALIEQLETLVDKSQVPTEATAVETDGPIDQALIDKIKETISAIVQTTGVRYDLEIREHLVAAGLQRLADLTVSQGQELLKALDAKQLSAWAETALKPVAAG